MTEVLSLWHGRMIALPRTARQIATDIAEAHGFTFEDLAGPRKFKELARARQEAMWACRQVTGKDGKPRYSYPFIGRLFGGRDHTTVLTGARAHAKRLEAEKVAA